MGRPEIIILIVIMGLLLAALFPMYFGRDAALSALSDIRALMRLSLYCLLIAAALPVFVIISVLWVAVFQILFFPFIAASRVFGIGVPEAVYRIITLLPEALDRLSARLCIRVFGSSGSGE